MKPVALAFAAALTCVALPALAAPPAPTYAFVNGRWWDGARYVDKTMYTVSGLLSATPPRRIDETIDLQHRFVIPPLAEGHTHWLIPAFVSKFNACYLADGVFYVRDMANGPFLYNQFRDQVNLPDSVDFITALQGFTGPGGHPVDVLEQGQAFGVIPKSWKPDFDPDGELVVQTDRDVDARMKLLVGENPALVKVFLVYSDQYEARLHDPAARGAGRGMDPKLLPHLVTLAHANGLKVAAHVYSAADFRTAVRAGVDEIAHLPGHGYDKTLDFGVYRLTAEDAREAARAGVKVTTTLTKLPAREKSMPPDAYRAWRDTVVIANLKLLKAAGVPILIGSDEPTQDVLPEIAVVRDLGVFSNTELLNIATRDTARDIFPDRKIGRLESSYEADFLVLDQDPTQNLDNLHSISLRVKQGRRLTPAAWALKRPSASCV